LNARNLLFDVFKSERLAARATERSVGTQANVGHTAYGTMTDDTFYNIGQ